MMKRILAVLLLALLAVAPASARLNVNQLTGFNAVQPSGSDGNDEFTVLLLHADGTDGGVTFTDVSVAGEHGDASVDGDAHTETDQSIFGGASFYGTTSGTGTIYYATDADWNLGGTGGGNDFTIDMWVRVDAENATSSDATILSTNNSTNGWNLSINLSTRIRLRVGTSNYDITHSLSADTWYHIAVIRSGTTITCAVDGASVGTFTDVDMNNDGEALRFNSASSGGSFPADLYLDEIRISKGVARWTSFPFTPPASPYS